MASEKTFVDRLARAGQLGSAVANFTPLFAAVDSRFSIATLDSKMEDAEDANTAVADAKEIYGDVVDQREALAKEIGPLVTQSLAYVKSNTLWKSKFERVKGLADKVRGVRPKKPKATTGEGEETPTVEKAREQGERSYAEIASFFRQYVKRLEDLGGYVPPDTKITLLALGAKRDALEALNESAADELEDFRATVTARREAYEGPEGLKFTFDGMKTAVKGQYGQASTQYGEIVGIKW